MLIEIVSSPVFERRVEFTPAYDRRDPDPTKNCGVHGVDLRFLFIGPVGATQFMVFTNWMLPHIYEEQDGPQGLAGHMLCRPLPADLGYHSPVPLYDEQDEAHCDVLPGGRCYYDGSALAAKDLFERFVAEGDKAVWAVLELQYTHYFGGCPL